jgi:hypothetical protein
VKNDLAQVRLLYRRALGALKDSGLPFAVGGAYALGVHTGIHRETKDLDIFTLPDRAPEVLKLFSDLGYPSVMVARHWLGKITWEDAVIDIIFGFRNGVSQVAPDWFDRAREAELFEKSVPVLAPEEMIWSKVFVAERHRYDGADIAHLIRAGADGMDWARLRDLFGVHWPLLLSSLVLFGYVYPAERSKIPDGLVRELVERWQRQGNSSGPEICRGTLLSHSQFLHDVTAANLLDARVLPIGNLEADHVND